jgi:hypothetical protein
LPNYYASSILHHDSFISPLLYQRATMIIYKIFESPVMSHNPYSDWRHSDTLVSNITIHLELGSTERELGFTHVGQYFFALTEVDRHVESCSANPPNVEENIEAACSVVED